MSFERLADMIADTRADERRGRVETIAKLEDSKWEHPTCLRLQVVVPVRVKPTKLLAVYESALSVEVLYEIVGRAIGLFSGVEGRESGQRRLDCSEVETSDIVDHLFVGLDLPGI